MGSAAAYSIGTIMTRRILSVLPVLAVSFLLLTTPVGAVSNLQIASPLQAFTIWDSPPETPRSRFLPRFRAGLEAEVAIRRTAQREPSTGASAAAPEDGTSTDWAQRAAAAERGRKSRIERAAAGAFARAFHRVDTEQLHPRQSNDDNNNNNHHQQQRQPRSEKYQFVGVVNPATATRPITWYARPKPSDSAWSVRLLHVNQRAILYDLFKQGKVDLFAKYKHQGKVVTTEDGIPTRQPKIAAEYIVRERSWK